MGELDVAPSLGEVRVVASRRPEYALAEATVDIADGGTSRLDLALGRVVGTSGYIARDLQQHTARSADAGVSSAARLVWNAAEGVECAVASEHNLASDLQQDVAALRLESNT